MCPLPPFPSRLLRPALRWALAGALCCSACGRQSEGERCDPNNASLDCDEGLECKLASELNIEGRGVGLCCPPDGVTPNVNACLTNATLPEENITPADAGSSSEGAEGADGGGSPATTAGDGGS